MTRHPTKPVGRAAAAVRPTGVRESITERRCALIAVWLLGLAPIVMLPDLQNRWGWPTLLCALAAAIIALWARPAGRLPGWFAITLAVLCAWLTITALAGAAPLQQLLGRAPRYEGFIALGVIAAAAWAGARLLGPQAGISRRRHLFAALSTASVLLAFVAGLESVGLRPFPSDLLRPGSLTGNATDQGILGAILVAVLASAALGRWRQEQKVQWWWIIGAAAGIFSTATSNSRAGLLALAIVILGVVVRFLVTSRRRRRDLLIAGGVVVATFAVVVAVPLTRARLFGSGGFAQQTVGDRFIMWSDAWQLFLSSPWLGVGPNGFADAITPYFGDEWFTRADVGAILDSPHNVVVQAAVVGGIPGLICAGVLVIGSIVVGIRQARTLTTGQRDLALGALLAIPAAGIALLTHLTAPATLIPLAVLVGLLVAASVRERDAATGTGIRHSQMWRIGLTILGIIWFVMLSLFTVADAKLLAAQRSLMRGDVDAARSEFATAQQLRPWDVDIALIAAQSFGGALERGLSGAADAAEEWAERSIDVLPDSVRANFYAGMVAELRGENALAVQRLARAAELSPADPRLQHEYGVALFVDGDPAAARPHLIRALELAPDSEVSWQALGDVCASIDDTACVTAARSRTIPAP